MQPLAYSLITANLSEDLVNAKGESIYRYRLTRAWTWAPDNKGQVCWIMLNPSTATGLGDDRTIRRIVKFSDLWGYSSIVVVNLFAWRAAHPSNMIAANRMGQDIVGPDNDGWIEDAIEDASLVVCAWGKNGSLLGRSEKVEKLIRSMCEPHALLINSGGSPAHPLYIPGDTKLAKWR